MFPPERSAHTGPSPADAAGEERRDADRARALDDELRRARAGATIASLISSSVDVDDVVEQLVEDRRRQLARLLDGDAVGDRGAVPPRAVRSAPARRRAARSGRSARSAIAIPAASPPPPTGITTVAELRQLLGELEAERPLAGDHALVLERVDERRARLLGVLARRRERLVEHLADELDVARRSSRSRRPSPSARPAA